MKRLSLLLMLTACLLLPACSIGLPRQAMTCDEIVEAPLRSLDFDELSRERMPQWIELTYGVGSSELRVSEYDSIDMRVTESIEWSATGKRYRADFVGQEFRQLNVRWMERQPSSREAVDCFGEPELYEAAYGPYADTYELAFYMWYPEQGIVVSNSIYNRFGRLFQPKLNANTPLRSISIVRPGPADQMIDDVFGFVQPDAETKASWLEQLRPWPGTWEDLEIDVDPAVSP
jgi:hypothetical protein